MSNRVKYPLTQDGKSAAKSLVEAWDRNEVDQTFELVDVSAGSGLRVRQFAIALGADNSFSIPSMGTLNELAQFDLINVIKQITTRGLRLEVTLLQELRNAVESDFEVSDFFLTISAVGTIIYGDLVMDSGATFQSAAAGVGDVNVTAQQLPDAIVRLLGEDALRPEIAAAITDLKTADEPTRLEKMGKVIEELGRGLGHLSNTGGALAAIALITKILSGGGL